MVQQNIKKVKVSEEVRETFKFNMPTGVNSSTVWAKEAAYSMSTSFLPATIFIGIAYSLGAWFMWNELNMKVPTIILGFIAAVGILLTLWTPIIATITQTSFLRQLRKEMKKANVKFFLEKDKNKPVTNRVNNRALRALVPTFSGRTAVTVGFIKGDTNVDYGMRYKVRGFDNNGEVALAFTPTEPEIYGSDYENYSVETSKTKAEDVGLFAEAGGHVLVGIAAVISGLN